MQRADRPGKKPGANARKMKQRERNDRVFHPAAIGQTGQIDQSDDPVNRAGHIKFSRRIACTGKLPDRNRAEGYPAGAVSKQEQETETI